MSEKEFYKLAFLKASEGSLGGKTITYTAFRIHINGEKFLNLSDVPFRQFKNNISSKMSYDFSQGLGKEMRDNHIEFFQYVSARRENEGQNIGVLTPQSLQKNPALEILLII